MTNSPSKPDPRADAFDGHDEHLVRAKQIHRLHGFLPVSRATWFSWVAKNRVPAGTKIGPGVTVWRVGDVKKALGL